MKILLALTLVLGTHAFAKEKAKEFHNCSCPGKTERCEKSVRCNVCCNGGSGSGTNLMAPQKGVPQNRSGN